MLFVGMGCWAEGVEAMGEEETAIVEGKRAAGSGRVNGEGEKRERGAHL